VRLFRLLPLLACAAAFASEPDYHSYANFEQVRVTHIALDLNVSFESKTVSGMADLYLHRRQPATQLILDTRGLHIRSVETSADGREFNRTTFAMGETDPILGTSLTIAISEPTRRVRIAYTTSAKASGLNWLTAAQTAGRRTPFFYTQCWSIHARSWVPLQDTPQVKFTFSANIHTPPGMLAVMSAENTPAAPHDGTFRFEMRQPIPPHGLALAVGDIAFRPVGARTGIYADPAVLHRAAKEFEDTERMLNAAERIAGPYRWERYDILLLPPGAVYGGMENPRLTFLAASELAGDKSKAGTVAHELAHSWSGNLVTNATWSDIWISEGIATYLARRIEEAVFNPHRVAIETWLEWQGLKDSLNRQILHPPSKGLDPDNLLGPIPYQKGALFLRTLELHDGRAKIDEFLRRYFARFAYESISSAEVLSYMRFIGLHPQAGWLDKLSLPADAAIPRADPFTPIAHSAAQWSRGLHIQTQSWIAPEWLHFLALLGGKDLARADTEFHFTQSSSQPILAFWLRKSIAENYQPALVRLDEFLAHPADPSSVVAIYSELVNTAQGKFRAASLFAKFRPAYSESLANQVAKILEP
jgi:leukotriene-A4 hydrolase